MRDDQRSLVEQTLAIVRGLSRELHADLPGVDRLDANASIERDFWIDSLARVELALRIERTCHRLIPDRALAEADTVLDLVQAMLRAPASAAAGSLAVSPSFDAGAAAPVAPATLLEALEWHALRQPDRAHIVFIDDTAGPVQMSFGELHAAASAVAAGLVQRGVQPQETVAIMLPTGREFFAAFYGALYARAIPVPLYPPARPSQIEIHLRRIGGILANCEARTLITFEGARSVAHLLRSLNSKLQAIITVAEASVPCTGFAVPAVKPGDIAFLQYTSGSTGQPKGVVLTHANLLSNLSAMQRVTGVTVADRFVSWLPLYHDMGLIGSCMGALVYGFPLVLMSPFAFLSHPVRWLRTIERYRATITAAPNFAYEICVDKIPAEELAGLDLGALRLAFNGAEAVSPHTITRFVERFSAYGLRPSALMPVYGLAECALGLTFPPPERGPRIDHIEREVFLRTGIARHSDRPEPQAQAVVSCGRALPGHSIRIVDTDGTPLAERTQGRIQFQGPSATRGYFKNPTETARLFDGNWLDSGDLGYLAEGELYVTGRAKDIIVRGGHNIHPQELEEAIGRLPEVRSGGVVAFPATDPRRGTERIVILVETRAQQPTARTDLTARINHLAVDLIGLPVDEVVLVPPRTVLKTSSGKVRRAACREAYEQGHLGASGRAPWIQFARLELRGLVTRATRRARRLVTTLWGIRAIAVGVCLALPSWFLVVLTPGLARRRRVAAAIIRLAAWLSGISIRVSAPTHPPSGPCVYVSNHASYLDVLVLTASLPPDISFVSKNDYEGTWILGTLLERLGCLFIERHDVHEAMTAARELQSALQAHRSLHVFAEGTFFHDPGVLPFHLGAFQAAAATGTAIVPVAIRGTRSMLADGNILPRPTPLAVVIGDPLMPRDASWASAIDLRRRCRASILSQVHEPDFELGQVGAAL